MEEFVAFRCEECRFRRECMIETEEECERQFEDRYGRSVKKGINRKTENVT